MQGLGERQARSAKTLDCKRLGFANGIATGPQKSANNSHINVMSRAFVKEQDIDAVEDLPDRPISEHPNDVTAEGMIQIETALADAREAYNVAQQSDDRAAMATASRDSRYWSARRATAQVVPHSGDATTVRFGSSVTIARDDGREQTFRIVGEDEADPARGTISHVSPLARAMFGKSVGDVVRAGSGEAEIRAIVA
jgi:transcription elongation GreA/GreB family factor